MTGAEFNTRQRRRRLATCTHFKGMQVRCAQGIDPAPLGLKPKQGGMIVLPCIRDDRWVRGSCAPECSKYVATTEAEVAAEDAELEHIVACIDRGVSPCCEAKLDERAVIGAGRHRGYGPRFCPSCKKLVFMV